jgi:ppGpp synthetase/RelA/SpoT-type nucleotidyltranferase
MALTEALIKEAGERYVREQDRYAKLAHFVADACQQQVVDTNVIRATVQWRAKVRKRFEAKLQKWLADPGKKDRTAKISTLDDVFDQVGGDLAGVRITTYVETDRDRVVEVIRRHFDGSGGSVDVDKKDATARERGSLYRATHCQVRLKPDDLVGTYENLAGLSCEIQVCSLLAHVWNEIEHDLGYKTLSGPLSSLEKDLLQVLGRETEAGDIVIASLLAEKERRSTGNAGAFIDEYDFVARMRERFPHATDFGANAGQLYEELVASGMDTPQKIEQELLRDGQDKAETLLQQLIKHMQAHNDVTVWIEPESSDQLLVLLLEKHLDEILARHPTGRGMGRPPRIVSFAKRFQDMKAAQSRQASRVAVG